MAKVTKPRQTKPINVSGDIEASAWYYRCPKTDEIVVEVRQPGTGHYIGTVTLRIRHPKNHGPGRVRER